ncbi:phage integrase N-terminal SAM-like domain-containing protein [Gimesia aquarii]|uniref:phage integrase N-terminal SAM-like domain-containing protein n=1 Tax=Gimesia aquarii TaxID=2527964 RepID=UPI0011A012AF
MRNKLRVRHYVWKTEQAYVMWIERFLCFHRERNRRRWRNPRQMGKMDIEQYLSA